MPPDIEAGRLVDRFGAQAVYGRPMSMKEMRRIVNAEYLERLHRAEMERPEESDSGDG